MKKSANLLFVVFLLSTFIFVFFSGEKLEMQSVEDLDIYLGVGVGLENYGKAGATYKIHVTLNSYKLDGSVDRVISTGAGSTIGKTREDRQNKIGNQRFFGLSKVYLLEEEYARFGIRPLVDITFKNPDINNNLYVVVCKGRSEDYFRSATPGYINSADYISDMIKASFNFNFFKPDNFMFKNVVLSMDAEGKNVISPYIEIMEEGIKINGMAVFRKDKLAAILNMKDTRIMNMLRESNVNGMLTIQKDSKEYINYEVESKRKITCKKIGDKFTFIIDLNLKGEIINNILYKGMASKIEVTDKFEEDMAKQVTLMCTSFLEKMKNEYKVDCLQLGWVAAAKYGRDTGVDWDEIVSKSEIKVNVKVQVDKVGRGQY